ncbi:MAG TPA: 1-phosphofructokinase [Candidatus Merdivicinus intestinavium]|nr:1-phosphofructokinase [Candidatus Merdivicinus intestinavium]
MIVTVTLNTAVDKLYLVDKLADYTVMRVNRVSNTAGGKGLNVSKVAAIAGEPVTATGFVGGFNGRYVESMLKEQGVETRLTHIAAETRSCINIREESTGRHTEFLEPGAAVTPEELERFWEDFCAASEGAKVVTISGSVPKGTPPDFYGRLIRYAKERGIRVLLDTSGQLLRDGAAARPTLIKPNTDEIEQLLGAPAKSEEELIAAAEKLRDGGIEIVVISLGKDGTLIACRDGVFRGVTPDIPVVNTVGCGDSMVAGFAVGLSRGYSLPETIRFAMAVSTANALTMETGYFKTEDLESLLGQVSVHKIK